MSEDLAVELTRTRALLRLDLLGPRSIVDWATEKLSEGIEVTGLVELAGLSDPAREVVDAALEGAADELGLNPLTEQDAGVTAAKWEASQLSRGSTTPIEAARKIWRIARLAPSAEPLLRVFVGLASEWEDDPYNRGSYEEEIRSEAIRLAGWPE